ncbi:hypothetical protein F4808DRAFT_41416 [Astrocystis sublimbata]|nr:hypothetical protein F4808DRAFT_41416 [Astrocystis sublimbata]
MAKIRFVQLLSWLCLAVHAKEYSVTATGELSPTQLSSSTRTQLSAVSSGFADWETGSWTTTWRSVGQFEERSATTSCAETVTKRQAGKVNLVSTAVPSLTRDKLDLVSLWRSRFFFGWPPFPMCALPNSWRLSSLTRCRKSRCLHIKQTIEILCKGVAILSQTCLQATTEQLQPGIFGPFNYRQELYPKLAPSMHAGNSHLGIDHACPRNVERLDIPPTHVFNNSTLGAWRMEWQCVSGSRRRRKSNNGQVKDA